MAWPLTTTPIASYDSLMTATYDASLPQFRNVIYDVNHTMDLLRQKGRILPYNMGGIGLRVPLMYGENSTGEWLRSSRSLVDLTPQAGFGPAQYSKARWAGSLTFTKDEEEDNRGEEAIFSLYDGKVKQLNFAARKALQDTIYTGTQNGTFPERISGLDELISVTQTFGAISPVTYAWWTPKAATAADFDDITNYTGILAMEQLQTDCTFAGSSPDMYPCPSTVWQAILKMMIDKTRFPLVGTKAAGGRLSWNAVAFHNGMIYEDIDIPAANGDVMYFLCSECLTLYYIPTSNYTMTPPVTPNNQLAFSRLVTWRGNLVTDNRQTMGRLQCNGL